jgi:hypothetical protein
MSHTELVKGDGHHGLRPGYQYVSGNTGNPANAPPSHIHTPVHLLMCVSYKHEEGHEPFGKTLHNRQHV